MVQEPTLACVDREASLAQVEGRKSLQYKREIKDDHRQSPIFFRVRQPR